jgi:hypothetical protein
VKDPRYEDKSPHSSEEQAQPEPERPAGQEAEAASPWSCESLSEEDKPSQAEGERDKA